MISIVVYLWQGPDPRRAFLPTHVNVLADSIRRTLSCAHRFICIADEPDGLAPWVEFVRTPPGAGRLAMIQSLEGSRFPSCYRRLWTFSREAGELLGSRIMLADIDLVAVRDFAHLCARTEPFVGWRPRAPWGNPLRVGGGLYLLDAGAHPEVYEEFAADPLTVQRGTRLQGFRGSDQAVISRYLGARAATWAEPSGIYSIRDLKDGRLPLPEDACLVQFNGPVKPWQSSLPWVREHWRVSPPARASASP